MQILDNNQSSLLREEYIKFFIDIESSYYLKYIANDISHQGKPYYTGYLWDCIKYPVVIPEHVGIQALCAKQNIFAMVDIHSDDRSPTADRWIYPKTNILLFESWPNDVLTELPEDIYLFDRSFSWSVIFTHEFYDNGSRYCLFTQRVGQTN